MDEFYRVAFPTDTIAKAQEPTFVSTFAFRSISDVSWKFLQARRKRTRGSGCSSKRLQQQEGVAQEPPPFPKKGKTTELFTRGARDGCGHVPRYGVT